MTEEFKEIIRRSSETLTLAIKDNFPDIVLEFIEDNEKTRLSYPVDLNFESVKYIDNDRVVFYGDLTVSLNPFGKGTIEYQFNTQEFYRVSYSDITTRSRKLHKLIPDNREEINMLMSFITKYLYSTEDFEHNIDINGPTPSKHR